MVPTVRESKLPKACERGPGTWFYGLWRVVKGQQEPRTQDKASLAQPPLLARPCLLLLMTVPDEVCEGLKQPKMQPWLQLAFNPPHPHPPPLEASHTSPPRAVTFLILMCDVLRSFNGGVVGH